jgi:hypothetical protein
MPSSAQRSASQVPGEEAFNRHHQPVARGGHGLEQGVWSGVHVAVQQDIPLLVHDTDIPAAGMPVDTAVKWVRLGRESPEVSSSCVRERCAQRQQSHWGMLRGRPQALSFACGGRGKPCR